MGLMDNNGELQAGLRVRTALGVLWKNISNSCQSLIDLVATAVLARLLVPEDFGVVTMSMIFVALAFTINELGLGAALIQRKDPTPGHLDSTFWSAALMGAGLLVTFTLLAPMLASFFRTPALEAVLPVLSLNFMVGSLGLVHRTLLEREMRFRHLARCDVAAAVGFGISSVGLALAGAGVWSIVAGKVIQRAIATGLYWVSYPWRPGFRFSWRHFRELMGFGANVMGDNMAAYLYTNVDYALVGRFLGSTALGLYGMAYRIVTLPLQKISIAVMSAVYPAFSRVQDDPPRMVRGYLTTITHLSIIIMPMLVGLMALAPELVTGIFGEHWRPAVRPLQIMVAAGLAKSIGAPVNSAFRACGRPDVALKVTLAALVLTIGCVAAGIPFGIAGVAAGISVSSVSAFMIAQLVLCRLLRFPMGHIIRSLLPSAWLSAAMLAILLAYRYIGGLYLSVSGLSLAASSIILGLAFYYCALRVGESGLYSELIGLLRSALQDKA
ncbi:MAG: MOP flippase family protein [Deltaproteobacteria bacterium]|nr:MOP flippase family protein [Deltaproteobacteria bacterium]